MNTARIADSVWIKIGLALVPVVGLMIATWADVRSMKSERTLITDGRLVRLEESQLAQNQQIEDIKRQLQLLWARRARPEPN